MKRTRGRAAVTGMCAALGLGLMTALTVGLPAGGLAGCARQARGPVIRVSGAWALYPMMVRWSEEFRQIHPDVRIDVSAGGAGKGAADALAGRADIGMVSRDIRPEELAQDAFWVPVAKTAVFATLNAANPVASELAAQGIKRSTLIALWTGGSPPTWGEVVGKPAVKDRVRVYVRGDACGAAETWARYLGKQVADLKGVAGFGDDRLTDTLRRDPQGIGFNNLAYAYDAQTGRPTAGLMVVPIDLNADGRLDDHEDFYGTIGQARTAIAAGVYPPLLTHEVYLLTRGKPTGLVQEFMRWVLRDGQELVGPAGCIALGPDQLAAGIAKLR